MQLKQMQEFIPEKLKKMKEQLKEIEIKRAKLLSAQGTWIKLESLNKDLASVKETMDSFEKDRENSVNKADIVSIN
jgi:hypothetical protein